MSGVKLAVAVVPGAYRWARLATNLARYALGRPHEPDFRLFATLAGDGPVLDVGANNGMSALSIRAVNRRAPILSVEASRLHEPELRLLRALLPRFHYLLAAAGEGDARLTLHTPCFARTPITGEASLESRAASEISWFRANVPRRLWRWYSVRTETVDVIALDRLGLDPTAVKIDVEGAEPAVLRGLAGTLARSRPVVLLERSGSFPDVRRLLEARGYRAHRLDVASGALVPLTDDGQASLNAFFLPPPCPAAAS